MAQIIRLRTADLRNICEEDRVRVCVLLLLLWTRGIRRFEIERVKVSVGFKRPKKIEIQTHPRHRWSRTYT